MAKKKVTTREKIHNNLDTMIDFVIDTKEKTSSAADKAGDAIKKGGNYVADKINNLVKPIKLKMELDKRAKSIGYGAILGDIANKIKKGASLTEEESLIFKKLSNEEL